MPLMSLRQPKSLGLCLGLCRAVPSRTQTLLGETARRWGGAAGAPLPRASRVTRSSHLEAPPARVWQARVTQVEQGHHRAPGMFLQLQPCWLWAGGMLPPPTQPGAACSQGKLRHGGGCGRGSHWQSCSTAIAPRVSSAPSICPLPCPSPSPCPRASPALPRRHVLALLTACRTHGDGQGSDGTPGCLVGIPKGDALRGHWHGVRGEGLMAGAGV